MCIHKCRQCQSTSFSSFPWLFRRRLCFWSLIGKSSLSVPTRVPSISQDRNLTSETLMLNAHTNSNAWRPPHQWIDRKPTFVSMFPWNESFCLGLWVLLTEEGSPSDKISHKINRPCCQQKSTSRGLLTIKWIWDTCNHLLAFHLWWTSVWLQSIFSKKELPLAFFGVSQFRLPLPQRTPIEYLCFLSGLLFCNLQVFGCWEFPHQVWVFFSIFFLTRGSFVYFFR